MVAAVVAAATLTCQAQPGLGTLAYTRGGREQALDLANCKERVLRSGTVKRPTVNSPDGRLAAEVRVRRAGERGTQAVVIRDRRTGRTRTIHSVRESYRGAPAGTPGPLVLLGWSGDGRWLFFSVDPFGSNSIAADGLVLQAVSVHGGPAHRIGMRLAYPDYMTWCGGRLVFTGGGNRLATTNKRLLIASPPAWRAHPLAASAGRAWGSVVCAPGGRAVVAQSQRESQEYDFAATRWQLWRVGLHGTQTRLTTPPVGSADDAPRFSRDGRLFFVRSRQGSGTLRVLHPGGATGLVARLGYNLGYYGHRSWWLGS